MTSLEDQLTKLGEYNAQQGRLVNNAASILLSSSAPVSLPPPVDLTMKHFSNTCLLIKWSPPLNTDPDMLKGYRIYVNSSPEGEVSNIQMYSTIPYNDTQLLIINPLVTLITVKIRYIHKDLTSALQRNRKTKVTPRK